MSADKSFPFSSENAITQLSYYGYGAHYPTGPGYRGIPLGSTMLSIKRDEMRAHEKKVQAILKAQKKRNTLGNDDCGTGDSASIKSEGSDVVLFDDMLNDKPCKQRSLESSAMPHSTNSTSTLQVGSSKHGIESTQTTNPIKKITSSRETTANNGHRFMPTRWFRRRCKFLRD